MEIKARQLEIIEAAGKILTESGINGLTTKNLAAEMGFSESALYRHFKSKEEIVLTMLFFLAKNMDERLSLCTKTNENPAEKLFTVFNNQFEFFQTNPHFMTAVFSDGLMEASKTINEGIIKIMTVKKGHLLAIIKQGQSEKYFTKEISADELVHIIMGSFRLHMLQWKMSGYTFNLKQKGNKLISNLITLISYKKE